MREKEKNETGPLRSRLALALRDLLHGVLVDLQDGLLDGEGLARNNGRVIVGVLGEEQIELGRESIEVVKSGLARVREVEAFVVGVSTHERDAASRVIKEMTERALEFTGGILEHLLHSGEALGRVLEVLDNEVGD